MAIRGPRKAKTRIVVDGAGSHSWLIECAREDSNLWPLPPEGSSRGRPPPKREDLRRYEAVCAGSSGVCDGSVC